MRTFLLTLLAVAVPIAALADTTSDLQKIKTAFTSAKSFHATELMPDGKTITVDYVAPDRWRIQPTPKITELLIGNDVYMVQNGKTQKMPIPGRMLEDAINGFKVSPIDEDVKSSAKDLGMQPLSGATYHEYQFTTHNTPVTLYVDRNNLPVESIVATNRGNVTITYSNWNGPIDISP
jgi:hypothetical protein